MFVLIFNEMFALSVNWIKFNVASFHGIGQSTWRACRLCMQHTCSMWCYCTTDNTVDGYTCSWLQCGLHQMNDVDRTAVSPSMGFHGEALGSVLHFVLMAFEQAAQWLISSGIQFKFILPCTFRYRDHALHYWNSCPITQSHTSPRS